MTDLITLVNEAVRCRLDCLLDFSDADKLIASNRVHQELKLAIKEWQDEIDRRDDIINSDKIVIADIVDQNCRLRVQLASMRITFGTILAIADTHGCRIETAMDGCDKIMELCKPHTTNLPDSPREGHTGATP